MNALHTIAVHSSKEIDQFIGFPFDLHANDPYWISPPRVAIRDQIDPKKNPFFEHAIFQPFLAFRNKKCVGRIAATIDHDYNRVHGVRTVLFGYLDFINDQAVAESLFQAVTRWGLEHGMSDLLGPINLSTNYECGLLVEGFLESPSVMMLYHPAFYQSILESLGFRKAKDLYTYEISRELMLLSDKQKRICERLKTRSKVRFRVFNMARFEEEISLILNIYNDAWEKNWGFVPLNAKEFRHIAQDMKLIMDPRLCVIAFVNDAPAGFSLALPDANQAFRKVKNGKLFPTGLMKLLWHLKGPTRHKTVDRVRILTLGIKKEYQSLGLGALLYAYYREVGPKLGFNKGEAGWILENNFPMNQAMLQMNAQRSKVYRLFEKPL